MKYNIKMRFYVVISLLCCCFYSCISIEGITSDYDKLNEEQKSRIIKYDGSIEELSVDGNVYVIKTGQVRDFISNHNNVIIYDYTPWCKGDNCVSPIMLEKICNDNGFKLLLIADSFVEIFKTKSQQSPMLFIDYDVYNTKKRNKYIRLFFDELTQTSEKQRGCGMFYVFEKGTFKGAKNNISEVFSGI